MEANDSKTPLPTCPNAKKGDTLTLSEYILERLSNKSDMVLVVFSMIMSFPKMFKYKMSVSN